LIRKAFPQTEVQDLSTRIQAMNYLGSTLAQKVSKIPDTVFLRCLVLILDQTTEE
jgi:hypothetical protein